MATDASNDNTQPVRPLSVFECNEIAREVLKLLSEQPSSAFYCDGISVISKDITRDVGGGINAGATVTLTFQANAVAAMNVVRAMDMVRFQEQQRAAEQERKRLELEAIQQGIRAKPKVDTVQLQWQLRQRDYRSPSTYDASVYSTWPTKEQIEKMTAPKFSGHPDMDSPTVARLKSLFSSMSKPEINIGFDFNTDHVKDSISYLKQSIINQTTTMETSISVPVVEIVSEEIKQLELKAKAIRFIARSMYGKTHSQLAVAFLGTINDIQNKRDHIASINKQRNAAIASGVEFKEPCRQMSPDWKREMRDDAMADDLPF